MVAVINQRTEEIEVARRTVQRIVKTVFIVVVVIVIVVVVIWCLDLVIRKFCVCCSFLSIQVQTTRKRNYCIFPKL